VLPLARPTHRHARGYCALHLLPRKRACSLVCRRFPSWHEGGKLCFRACTTSCCVNPASFSALVTPFIFRVWNGSVHLLYSNIRMQGSSVGHLVIGPLVAPVLDLRAVMHCVRARPLPPARPLPRPPRPPCRPDKGTGGPDATPDPGASSGGTVGAPERPSASDPPP
jgi:hypothetical protein